jgi:hypothetical protein
MESCFAFCADVSHGAQGWRGPLRRGEDAAQQAQGDVDRHLEHNPEHKPSVSCGNDSLSHGQSR